jgi:hypothetical protein
MAFSEGIFLQFIKLHNSNSSQYSKQILLKRFGFFGSTMFLHRVFRLQSGACSPLLPVALQGCSGLSSVPDQ